MSNVETPTMHALDELAERFSVHPKTLSRYVRQGRLKAVKIGRRRLVSDAELTRFLNAEKPCVA